MRRMEEEEDGGGEGWRKRRRMEDKKWRRMERSKETVLDDQSPTAKQESLTRVRIPAFLWNHTQEIPGFGMDFPSQSSPTNPPC